MYIHTHTHTHTHRHKLKQRSALDRLPRSKDAAEHNVLYGNEYNEDGNTKFDEGYEMKCLRLNGDIIDKISDFVPAHAAPALGRWRILEQVLLLLSCCLRHICAFSH